MYVICVGLQGGEGELKDGLEQLEGNVTKLFWAMKEKYEELDIQQARVR